MQKSKVSVAAFAAVALVAGIGTASAQSTTTTTTTTTISPDEETTIYRTITREQAAMQPPPPPDWAPSVGVQVPAQVQLYNMPSTVEVPSVQSERYTVVNGHVVLVDPGTRRVVRIIER